MSRRLDDPALVAEQYAREDRLAARKAVHARGEGPDALEVTFAAVVEAGPQRVLEVGGGEGELAQRIVHELGVALVGVDQSPRMVEIQQAKGIDAYVGDVQALPFDDATFDVALAAWMLFHVLDIDRGLSELARVLRSGGRLVAVTNAIDHMRELWDLAGRETSMRKATFRSENGEALLRRHFADVEARHVRSWLTMDDDAVRGYAGSWEGLNAALDALPLAQPLRVRRLSTVFVATKT